MFEFESNYFELTAKKEVFLEYDRGVCFDAVWARLEEDEENEISVFIKSIQSYTLSGFVDAFNLSEYDIEVMALEPEERPQDFADFSLYTQFEYFSDFIDALS